jgi:acetylglutamate kinase
MQNIQDGVSSINRERTKALISALPYIHEFRDKTIVIKYGGSAMINDDLKQAVIQDVIFLQIAGIRTVLLHGGGPEIESVLNALDIKSRFINGLRYTDEETMKIVQMVLCGKVNKDIVRLIENAGARAIGICGLDGGLLRAMPLPDLGFVGEVTSVNTSFLNQILDSGIIPVISPVAMGVEGAAFHSFNVNADTAAAKIAASLSAEKLILITDVRGILTDVHNPDTLQKELDLAALARLRADGTITKGMLPKAECCRTAIEGGVKKAHIIDGRLPHALLIELFTDEGIGTMIA